MGSKPDNGLCDIDIDGGGDIRIADFGLAIAFTRLIKLVSDWRNCPPSPARKTTRRRDSRRFVYPTPGSSQEGLKKAPLSLR